MDQLPRGFPPEEFPARLARTQSAMREAGLDALLLTTEADIFWVTGFFTRFWESPTRPWFVLVPAHGMPVAVIPAIGAALMGKSWLDDIRTWPAPNPCDDGISLLADTIGARIGKRCRIGIPSGPETHLRLPLGQFDALKAACPHVRFTGDSAIMVAMRLIKSSAEIDKISVACAIAGRAFARVPDFAGQGFSLSDVFTRFQIAALEEGADRIAYLAGGAGPDGYDDVISPAENVPLQPGDVVMLDTGLVHDGYFCDFDRNWSVGPGSQLARDTHARLIEAVDVAVQMVRPGARACEVFAAMHAITGGNIDTAGRFGHGLGTQLTEWPSLMPGDETVICENMVLTLEPSMSTREGRLMVHEENIVVTGNGARFLSPRIGPELAEI